MAFRIELRRDTAANWTTANPILAPGEPGLELDTGKVKYGDGATAWTSLAYAAGGTGGGISVVDNGDGTLSTTSTAVVDNGDGTLTAA